MVRDPAQYDGLGGGGSERLDALEQGDEVGEDGRGVLFPTLAHVLLGILGGRLKEEAHLRPQFADEVGARLDHRHRAREVVKVLPQNFAHRVLSFVLNQRFSQRAVVHAADVLVVEPLALLEVELGTLLGAVLKGESLDEFVHRHQFAVVAGVPS